MAYVFIQVPKQFHNNALNDHNFGYMTKGWCPITSSVIPSLSRVGSDTTGQIEVKGSVASGVRVLTQRATSASWDRGTRIIILVDDDILKWL